MDNVYAKKPWLKGYDQHVQANLSYEEKTFAEQFEEIAKKLPDKVAFNYIDLPFTFGQLDELSNRLAAYFIECGLMPDDVVGLHMPNIPAHFIAVVAAQKAGCVTTGLSPLLTPHELEHQLNDSGAKVILTVDSLVDSIATVSDKITLSRVIISSAADFLTDNPESELRQIEGKTVVSFMDAINNSSSDPVLVARNMDDMIFIMYTGGTTGLAKGAVLTQRSYMSNRMQTGTWLDMKEQDTLICAFPLFHMAGLAMSTFMLTRGATQICVPNPRDIEGLIKSIQVYKPSVLINVPTVFFELLKRTEFRDLDFNNLRWCVSGAAPMPAEYIEDLEKVIGKNRFIELYGMTETSPVICSNPRYGVKKVGSVGMPISDTEIKLVDSATGQLAALGEPGEIAARGPQVMRGYFNQPEETNYAIREGWMFTGDVAYMDADGYLYIVDRVKDMVNVSGFKVFTRELDDILIKHGDIDAAASVGIEDKSRPGSERLAVAIILKPGVEKSDAEKEKIIAYLRETVAAYKVPKVIEFMDQFPVSSVGKILKRELRETLRQEFEKELQPR